MHKEENGKYEAISYSETLKSFLANLLFFGMLCGILLEISNWTQWLPVAGFSALALMATQSAIRSGFSVIGSSKVAFSGTPPSLKRWTASFVMSIESIFMIGCSTFLYSQLF